MISYQSLLLSTIVLNNTNVLQIKCKIDTKDKYITIYYSFLKIYTIITI